MRDGYYDFVALVSLSKSRSECVLLGFAKIWKSWTPSKIVVFSWQVLYNRLSFFSIRLEGGFTQVVRYLGMSLMANCPSFILVDVRVFLPSAHSL